MEQAIIAAIREIENEDTIYYPTFFSFEGGEGSGKSSVLKSVGEKLQADGYDVFITREPGGNTTTVSEDIRALILDDKMKDMTPLTEAFLYAASRTQHVQEVVKPRLAKKQLILTDRYVDSSIVYQGLEWGNVEKVVRLNAIAICQTMPATTLFFDVPPQIALKHVFENRTEEINHFDQRDIQFHERVYQNFKAIAKIFDKRYTTIDATKPLEQVIETTYQTILKIIDAE